MKNYARIENNKVFEIIQSEEMPVFHPSLVWHECPENTCAGWIYDGGIFSPPAVDLAVLKAQKNDEINHARADANSTSFVHAGHTISCDQLSRGDIDGQANHIALFGEFTPDFPGLWKTEDNEYIPMPNVEAFKAMYQSMTIAGTANFNRSQALKEELADAETAEEISQIVW